eukprot:CAMPEP_0196666242 /NCGR_PEP_ID=MMETSP1086-20130531/64399_1 /TAXON_ID=77921 /ORGANISM="Cyanoptyche  gloeocystis , Strain SAG4.97" /LENGTH=380 /DNA_ID=CAMNT_0042003409 /DNA_START=67 /DNA_END=1209 /DNA_ORIENTATION=+
MKSRIILGFLLLGVFEVAVSQTCALTSSLYNTGGTAASCGYYPLLFCSNWLTEYNPNGTTLGNAYGFFCAGTPTNGDRQFFNVLSTSYAALSVPSSTVQTSVVALDQSINTLVDSTSPGSWEWAEKNLIFDFGWPLPSTQVFTATDDTLNYLQILPGTQDSSIFSALPMKSANATCRAQFAAFRCAHGFYQTSSSRVSSINGISSPAFIGVTTTTAQETTTWFTSPTSGSPDFTPSTTTGLNPMCSERNFKSIDPLPCFNACYDLVLACNLALVGASTAEFSSSSTTLKQITVQSFCDALSSATAATRAGDPSTATTTALRTGTLAVPQLFKPRNRVVSNFLADVDSYSGNCYLFNAASSAKISVSVLLSAMLLVVYLSM